MTPHCAEVAAQVYHYLDNEELTWWQRLRIKWHLDQCPPCTRAFDFEEKLKERVAADCIDDIPQELEQRLMTFIKEHADDDLVG